MEVHVSHAGSSSHCQGHKKASGKKALLRSLRCLCSAAALSARSSAAFLSAALPSRTSVSQSFLAPFVRLPLAKTETVKNCSEDKRRKKSFAVDQTSNETWGGQNPRQTFERQKNFFKICYLGSVKTRTCCKSERLHPQDEYVSRTDLIHV